MAGCKKRLGIAAATMRGVRRGHAIGTSLRVGFFPLARMTASLVPGVEAMARRRQKEIHTMQKITPFLWFDDNAEEAMNLYTSLFHDGEITSVNRIGGEDAAILTGSFRIGGLEISVMNAGPEFTFTPSVSFYVTCESTEEVER